MSTLKNILLNSLLEKISSDLKMTPQEHQVRVADKLEDAEGILAYHGLGSGKTFSAINAANETGLPILAITPASLRENFKKELAASGYKGEAEVMSYEQAVRQLENQDFLDRAAKSLVVYDEAHRMGRQESMRSKIPALIKAKKSLLLTGTPIRNRPEEILPLLRGINEKGVPSLKAFKDTFIEKKKVDPGFWARMLGVDIGSYDKPKNLNKFKKLVKGKVDYHSAYDAEFFPTSSEEVIGVQMSDAQKDAYSMMMGKYPALAYKIKHGIPPGRKDFGKLMNFMTGPRQVANTPGPFAANSKPEDATKIMRAVDEIEKRKSEDKDFKGVLYSNFLSSGIEPVSEELDRRGIKHIKFTGQLNDKAKKKAVEDYNSGEVPVLLISGAGSEGLDLKGTKLMQILEPHWNEELINQVKGRAIRYKSHYALPEKDRHVTIQRFHSKVKPGKIKKMLQWVAPNYFKDDKSADEYLSDISKRKTELNDQFLKVMRKL